MTTSSPHSVHALVRLLKSPTDPPSTPGPSKIEIACLAWSDTSFRAANKGEVVGEWILTLFGQAKKTRREKDANSSPDPIADSTYWTLLCAVLTTPPPTTARPIKTWLLPLVNRLQVDAIVIEVLILQSSKVLTPARAVLTVLWPLVERKISVDALSECLSAVFDACVEWERMDDNLVWICSAVVATYRSALANARNKKKLYNCFLATHLPSWLRAVCTSTSSVSLSSAKRLQDTIYAAGIDTLFSLDALKQPLDTLFDALSSSVSPPFSVLPKLCTSFLLATHRHKSALFVPATNVLGGREEVRKKAIEFIGRCWVLIRSSATLHEDLEMEKWKSVIGVLQVVEKERLFVAHPVRGMHTDATKGEDGGVLALSEVRDKAVEMLEIVGASSSKDHLSGQVVPCVQLLDVLVQIEYDFIGPVLEKVLSALINILSPLSYLVKTASMEFLTHVLEYHGKTRTVHTYALALLDAVVSSSTSWTLSFRFIKSAFPLAYHLPVLAHVLRTSLTLTQITPLVTAVLQAVETAYGAFKSVGEREMSAKKLKVNEDWNNTGGEARLVSVQAQVFSYVARVAGTILSNLPGNAYTKDEEYSLERLWPDVGKLGWTVVWDCLEEKTGRDHDTVEGRDGKKRKHTVDTDTGSDSALYPHIVASAALRFLYDVRARVSFGLGDSDWLEEVHVRTLLNVALDKASDPELIFEIIRTLLWHVWLTHNNECQKQTEIHSIFTVTLDILTTCLLSKSTWSGIPSALTRDNLGLAVLHVLTGRWIEVLDASASTDILERFISLLLGVFLDQSEEDVQDSLDEIDIVVTFRGVFLDLLRNAQFWELHNIRAVFLSSVLTLTAPLAPYCFPTVGIELPSPITIILRTELSRAYDVYSLLQYVPPEYLTRPVRTELVERAMAGGVQMCTELEGIKGQGNRVKGKDGDRSDAGHRGKSHMKETDNTIPAEELEKWSCRLTLIRVFLQRMGQFLGTPSYSTSASILNHLLSPPSLSSPSKALTSVTLDLVQFHVMSLLRSREPEAAAPISSIISTLITARPFSQFHTQDAWSKLVLQSSVLMLIERTTSDFDSASLPDLVKRSLKALLETLESALLPHAKIFVENDPAELVQQLPSEQINAWSCMLSLKRWLGMNSQVGTIPFGLKLATSTIRKGNSTRPDSETCSSILGLLFEELQCMPDAVHRVYLDVLVGFYAVSDVEHVMDAHITRASKRMSIKDYSHLLDVLEKGIGGSDLQAGHRERLIHLGQVVLHDVPQGTLKVIQRFATQCFNLFANREEICGGSPHLKLRYLEFIARHCSDRPAAIRSMDLASIWSLLNRTLSGSSEHDTTTLFPVFHYIITIIGALVRLRRDLVVHTLPHLSLVLRQLMMLTRKTRPQLGAKQSKIVTDTFPSWLSVFQPLSTDEARALARLLVSLTTKTVPRTHVHASTEFQKAESLAKPFAKHAPYVLVAYVDAFNDPLCVIDTEMKKNLESGLFALCEMVGEHNRDALTVSTLDSGGKMILKSLWKEYEKQRYVGKG